MLDAMPDGTAVDLGLPPLALGPRLDRQHRTNLMANYMPRSSAQVIMLCTDTELTPDLSDIITPYVSRRFEIGAVGGGQRTEITVLNPEQDAQVLETTNAH